MAFYKITQIHDKIENCMLYVLFTAVLDKLGGLVALAPKIFLKPPNFAFGGLTNPP